MSIHIITLGTNISLLTSSLKHFKNIEKVYILTSQKISLKNKLFKQIIVNQNNSSNIISAIINIWELESDKNIYINITGGTNAMSSGALLGAYYTGSKAYYLSKNNVLMLPVPSISIISFFRKNKVLKQFFYDLRSQCPDSIYQKQIKSIKKPQVISRYLKILEQNGLIKTELIGREKLVFITNIGKLF